MPKSDMVEKKKLLIDGEELPGLMSVGEYSDEAASVDIATFGKIVKVSSNVRAIPDIEAVYSVRRDSRTLQFLQDWKNKFETHDVVCIRTDAAGNEFARELWPNTELRKCSGPAYDAASPAPAQAMVTFVPEDIIPIAAEA
jgi:hypothetical protein